MTLQEKHVVTANWSKLQNVYAITTTRIGGRSRGSYSQLNLGYHVDDEAEDVYFNRQELYKMLGQEPLWLRQVHGNRIIDADKAVNDFVADGAITTRQNFPIAVMTADCLPIVMADKNGQVIGIIHAGWRGLSLGIIEALIESFAFKGVMPFNIQAWIGPSISMRQYEVDEKIKNVFHEHPEAFTATKPGHWFADLKLIAMNKMKMKGLESISDSGLCTFSNENFFSYRRDHKCGRLATVVVKLSDI